MAGIITQLVIVFAVLVVMLGIAAWLTFVERRLLALWQDRYGPNRAGPFGLLQLAADAVKMLLKEDWTPPFADRAVFVIAPGIIIFTVLMGFAVVPFAPGIQVVSLNIGLLFFLAMAALGVYSIALAGWASGSKYSLLGGLRAAAQMVSYEVFMGLSLMGVVMMAGSFNLNDIVEAQKKIWFCVPQIIGLIIFVTAGIAEIHRMPFDLPEAENELVAGYHTEYSSMKFGMFFIGEYLGITLVSAFIVILFFGGWQGPAVIGHLLPPIVWFFIKLCVIISGFILIRAALPRPRYDQLMHYAWKFMLPLSLANVVVTGVIILATE